MLSDTMSNQAILNLDGYLLSLRRLSGNRCDFWAETFTFKGDLGKGLRDYLEGREITILDNKAVGYKGVNEALNTHLLSNLIIEDQTLQKLFCWDIVEYIEMSYRLLEPEINPLHSKQGFLFNVESEFHGKFVFIVIPIVNQAIAIGLATRAK